MTEQKKRYKAVIANQSYTIIGRESKQHMDMVTKLVNDQLTEIMGLSSQVDKEQAAILDVEIHNHVEAQQILNEQRKRKIQEKAAHG